VEHAPSPPPRTPGVADLHGRDEPPLVVLPPCDDPSPLARRHEVQLQGRSRRGEGFVEFEDTVVGGEFVPDEKRFHAGSIGRASPEVACERSRAVVRLEKRSRKLAA
jgi:hypothetical protein